MTDYLEDTLYINNFLDVSDLYELTGVGGQTEATMTYEYENIAYNMCYEYAVVDVGLLDSAIDDAQTYYFEIGN
jgi:hypothetical protein